MAVTASRGGSSLTEKVGRKAVDAKQDISQTADLWDEVLFDDEDDEEFDSRMDQMMRTVQMIGGAVIGIAIVTIVVNEVLTTNAVNNSTGPFGGVINSLETTGVAAMSLLVVGLLVAAASKLMSFFGGGF